METKFVGSVNMDKVLCKAPNCKENAELGSHCSFHHRRFKPLYKKYKKQQEKINKYLNDPKQIIENNNITDLLSIYEKIKTQYDLRIDYREKAFTPTNWDEGHKSFIKSLLDMMTLCENKLSNLYIKNLVEEKDETELDQEEKEAEKVTDNIDSQNIQKVNNIKKEVKTLIKTEQDDWKVLMDEFIKENERIYSEKFTIFNNYLDKIKIIFEQILKNQIEDEYFYMLMLMFYETRFFQANYNTNAYEVFIKPLIIVNIKTSREYLFDYSDKDFYHAGLTLHELTDKMDVLFLPQIIETIAYYYYNQKNNIKIVFFVFDRCLIKLKVYPQIIKLLQETFNSYEIFTTTKFKEITDIIAKLVGFELTKDIKGRLATNLYNPYKKKLHK